MKILQVIPYFFLSWSSGAPVELIHELSRSLVQRGHSVTIYTTDAFNKKDNKDKNIVEVDGIQVHEFKSKTKYPLCISPSMMRALLLAIRNFDVIHLHEYRTFQNIIAHHYAEKHGIPYVLQAHGSLPVTIGRKNLKKLYDITFGHRLLKDASRVIALTETEAAQYRTMGVPADKIEIIPNGVALLEFENLPRKGEFKKRYFIKDDEKIVLYLGRLDETKGIDLLLEAFARLPKNLLGKARLVLVGPDYGYQATLKRLVDSLKLNERTLFTGFFGKSGKMEAFVDSDVFVTPSFYGFPRTFLEACASGVPIITTEKGDELDWINNKVGYVVKYDADQLRGAIFKILTNEHLKEKFSKECKLTIKEKFDWSIIIKKVEQVYKDVIDKAH